MYGSSDTVAQIVAAIEKQRNNGKPKTAKRAFKLLKKKYEARADARVAKNWPVVSGELKIVREIHWEDERNQKNESLMFFKVGTHDDECLIFSGALVSAAKKAEIELFNEDDNGDLFLNDGFTVSIAPRKFAFDKA